MANAERNSTMLEPFFGVGPQVWPAMPAPAVGYFPPFVGNRPPIINNPSPAEPAASMSGWPVVATAPVGSGMAMPTAADFAAGIPPQALLAAVAMRRGQPMGPGNDQEIEDFIYDTLELMSGANDVEVRCDGGRATLTGSVAHKRLKRDVGEIAWAIPNVNDVQNNITIATRRRSRAPGRDTDTASGSGVGRKQV